MALTDQMPQFPGEAFESWPALRKTDFLRAVHAYRHRMERFGK